MKQNESIEVFKGLEIQSLKVLVLEDACIAWQRLSALPAAEPGALGLECNFSKLSLCSLQGPVSGSF